MKQKSNYLIRYLPEESFSPHHISLCVGDFIFSFDEFANAIKTIFAQPNNIFPNTIKILMKSVLKKLKALFSVVVSICPFSLLFLKVS